ncbi:hypothetical protein LCGC14_0696670 [marine sediment metagenome]|uniref:C-methyltransferase domain-containing protein n=1 Tax=marine sediment metagenome TaxID=412755 RepID=A0A0F9QJ01_9ZZZZ|nr:class I SAM-dependent methyltransferase [Methylophaga sp.]HEC59641.1 class I SAM-dependent methyltransferase [Methylophaga sp.]
MMTIPTEQRVCAICDGADKNTLHKQDFLIPSAKNALSYKVVCCEQCGFAYADNIPSQIELDAFYQDAEHHLHSVDIPVGLSSIHADFFDYVQQKLPLSEQSKVLDVGCSMGHFLNYFKLAGIQNLTGLEPSASATMLAKKHYDINVISSSLDKYQTSNKYDVISLCGVLEHIETLSAAINHMDDLLAVEGHVFIAVPDVESFGKLTLTEPFLEFALEHINFFSKTSLSNIFEINGFEMVHCESKYYPFYNNNYLLAVFKKSVDKTSCDDIVFDAVTKPSIEAYIQHSNDLLVSINNTLDLLIQSQEPVIVWGAGSFTTRLCATTRLSEVNLLGFVDKNAQLHTKTLLGRTIHPAKWVEENRQATIVIASSTYAKEITNELHNQYVWAGKIIEL